MAGPRMIVKPDWGGINSFLMSPQTEADVKHATEKIANVAATTAKTTAAQPAWTVTHGRVDDDNAHMRVEFGLTRTQNPVRHHGAIIVQHPQKTGRAKGRVGLRRALMLSGKARQLDKWKEQNPGDFAQVDALFADLYGADPNDL